MTLSYRNGVNVGEIIVYVPTGFIALFLAIRHGFGRNAGWIYLLAFSLVRIIGASLQLATISDPTNASLFKGSLTLSNIGLSPLLLATLGLLSHVLNVINTNHRSFFRTVHLRILQLPIAVGMILGIIGGVRAGRAATTTGTYTREKLSEAAVILFIIAFAAIVAATIATTFFVSHVPRSEVRLLSAVLLALPFLLVRLVYSVLAFFTENGRFNPLTGNVTIYLCMALLEEFIVVVMFEAVGLALPVVAKNERQGGVGLSSLDSLNATPSRDTGNGRLAKAVRRGRRT